jgi:hypothetical protein
MVKPPFLPPSSERYKQELPLSLLCLSFWRWSFKHYSTFRLPFQLEVAIQTFGVLQNGFAN